MSQAVKRMHLAFVALILAVCCILMIFEQQGITVPAMAEQDRPTAAPTELRPLTVQFSVTEMTVWENEAFFIPVQAEFWRAGDQADLRIQLLISDPQLDIVNTKMTSAKESLADLRRQDVIKLRVGNGARYLTAAKELTQTRSFSIRNRVSSTALGVGGAYLPDITGDRQIRFTLCPPADGASYVIGANNTLCITLLDVDALAPIKTAFADNAQRVAAYMPWLENKYRPGSYWNHLIGNGNDPDCVTSVPCQGGVHRGIGEVTEDMLPGTSICNATAQDGGYINLAGERPFLHLDADAYSFMQCTGYAMNIGTAVFGSSPFDGEGWATYQEQDQWQSLASGDYVRIEGHSFFVTDVAGDVVTVTECNAADAPCVILWGEQYRVVAGGTQVVRVPREGATQTATPPRRIEAVSRFAENRSRGDLQAKQ